ncbi:MAG: ComF family protein [Oscillospiraceae bacterium]|nr:ComF family protein [Oscillospiraceae bacterium]
MWLSKVIDFLIPRKCVFCGSITESENVCSECGKNLPYREQRQIDIEYADGAYAPFRYTQGVVKAIHRYKFGGAYQLAKPIGDYIAACLSDNLHQDVDIVTWVPVNRLRKLKRGYDQAQLLAQRVSKALGTECVSVLVKRKNIAPQFSMRNPEARRENVKDAYALKDKARVEGKRVLLVDDVITTGATLSKCCELLMQAGAKGVVCAAFAKAGTSDKT